MAIPWSRAHGLLAVAVLLTLPALLLLDALSPGRVLSAADWVFTTDYYRGSAPPGFRGPQNPMLYDQVFQFTPWRLMSWRALREHELPLWNPDSYCGTPLAATLGAAVFYPIHWLVLPMSFEHGLLWSSILRLWLAGIGTWLLVRRYGASTPAALVAGAAFMLCGYLVVWLGHPHTNVAVCLPWLILAGDHLVTATSRARVLGATAALAVLTAVQLTGGHIESSADLLVTLALYCVVRSAQGSDGRLRGLVARVLGRGLAWPGVAVLSGTLLAAPLLLPFVEWLGLSKELQLRHQTGFRLLDRFTLWEPQTLRDLASLPVVAFPNIFGNPTWGADWAPAFLTGNYNERVLYVGIVTLVLATGALIQIPRRRGTSPPWVLAWALIGLVSFGRAFNVPVFVWLNRLPLLDLGDPARNRLTVAFALCLLAAAGLDLLGQQLEDRARPARRSWLATSVFLLVAGTLGCALCPVQRIELYLPLLALAAFVLVLAMPVRHPTARAALVIGLVASDLLAFGRGFNPVLSEREFYPPNALATRPQRDESLHRTTALGATLLPDSHLFERFSDVRGMDYPTRWYSDYMDLTSDLIDWDVSYGVLLSGFQSPLTRVLNLKYVLVSGPAGLRDSPGVSWIARSRGVSLGKLTSPQPRSFMVHEAVQASDDDDAARLLAEDPDRVFRRVVLSDATDAVPLAAVGSEPGADGGASSEVVALEYGPHGSRWQVSSSRPGYVVTTDAFYPGWNAYLDGKPVAVHRANIAFRAVYLRAGRHLLEYRYEPASFRWGLLLAALGLGIVIAMGAAAAWDATRGSRRSGRLFPGGSLHSVPRARGEQLRTSRTERAGRHRRAR